MTASDAGLPSETHIGRVGLRVHALDRLVDFYADIVGLTVQERSADRATLGVGENPLLELVHAPDADQRASDQAGLFHTAVRVPDRATLADALVRTEENWELTGASDHRVSEALYLRDPEDNGVEIYRDRPRSEWPTADGRVQMDTLPLDLADLRSESSDASGTDGLPAATDIGHVHLEVTSLPAAREFYVDALGLGVRQELHGALFLAAGEYHHHVGLNRWNERSAPASGTGLAWFELLVPQESFADVRKRLREAGIDISETDDGIAVSDGDGIGIRISRA